MKTYQEIKLTCNKYFLLMLFKTSASHGPNHSDMVIKFGGKKNVEILLHIILGKRLIVLFCHTLSEADSHATANV